MDSGLAKATTDGGVPGRNNWRGLGRDGREAGISNGFLRKIFVPSESPSRFILSAMPFSSTATDSRFRFLLISYMYSCCGFSSVRSEDASQESTSSAPGLRLLYPQIFLVAPFSVAGTVAEYEAVFLQESVHDSLEVASFDQAEV